MRVLQGTQSGFLENLQEHEVHPASMAGTSPRHWDKLEPSAATSPNPWPRQETWKLLLDRQGCNGLPQGNLLSHLNRSNPSAASHWPWSWQRAGTTSFTIYPDMAGAALIPWQGSALSGSQGSCSQPLQLRAHQRLDPHMLAALKGCLAPSTFIGVFSSPCEFAKPS